MRGEVLGRVERRRRWSAGEKLAVVMASQEAGAVVAAVARRFEVTRQQIYDWRSAARRGAFGMAGGVVGFVEVVAGPPPCDPLVDVETTPVAAAARSATATGGTMVPPAAMMEIVLVGGRVLRAPTTLPTAELRRLIGAVEGA